MKRIPLLAAMLTAAFLTICFFQLWGRGIGFVPDITDWEMHPAWWHFNFLADCGVWLIETPAFYILDVFGNLAEAVGIKDFDNMPMFSVILVLMAFGIPVVFEALLVFWISKLGLLVAGYQARKCAANVVND